MVSRTWSFESSVNNANDAVAVICPHDSLPGITSIMTSERHVMVTLLRNYDFHLFGGSAKVISSRTNNLNVKSRLITEHPVIIPVRVKLCDLNITP